jgi:hypothetical protein
METAISSTYLLSVIWRLFILSNVSDHVPSLSDVFLEGTVGRAKKEPFLDIFGTLSSIELCSRNGQLISIWFHASIHSAQLSSVTGLAPAKKYY